MKSLKNQSMSQSTQIPQPSARERRLEKELEDLRLSIVYDLTGDYLHDCDIIKLTFPQSIEKLYEARNKAIDKIIEKVFKENQFVDTAVGERRAICPLCQKTPAGGYGEGYTFPIGLRRHLRGFSNQVQPCVILKAAFDYGRNHPSNN